MKISIRFLLGGALLTGYAFTQSLPLGHPKEPVIVRASRSELTDQVVPAASRSSIRPVPIRNYIDGYIFDKMKRDNIPSAGLATDAEFFRRVTLDLTGRLPEPDRIRRFVQDDDPGKREKAIEAILTVPYPI